VLTATLVPSVSSNSCPTVLHVSGGFEPFEEKNARTASAVFVYLYVTTPEPLDGFSFSLILGGLY
jgi:hypothetical protein